MGMGVEIYRPRGFAAGGQSGSTAAKGEGDQKTIVLWFNGGQVDLVRTALTIVEGGASSFWGGDGCVHFDDFSFLIWWLICSSAFWGAKLGGFHDFSWN